METPSTRLTGGASIVDRAAGFGIHSLVVDGQDVTAVHRAVGEARARAVAAPEVTAFIAKLEQDRSAVEAALSRPYSQGQTEGQITRLKALKRSMFGPANFDLLRKRFLVT